MDSVVPRLGAGTLRRPELSISTDRQLSVQSVENPRPIVRRSIEQVLTQAADDVAARKVGEILNLALAVEPRPSAAGEVLNRSALEAMQFLAGNDAAQLRSVTVPEHHRQGKISVVRR